MKKRVLYSLLFALCLMLSLIVADAFSAGSSFEEGMAHGLVFGILASAPLIGIIFGLQYIFTRIIRWIIRSKKQQASIYEFVPTMLFCLFILLVSYHDATTDKFIRYVANTRPASVHDVHHWSTSGFGSRNWIISFRISPEDFPVVLQKYAYAEETYKEFDVSGEETPKLRELDNFRRSRKNFPIPEPASPITVKYSYYKPSLKGGIHITIYTNDARNICYLFGSRN